MSADVVNLQAQVEAVLGSLVKAATVELIKLFEGRFRATARGPDGTRCADGEETFEVTNSLSTEGTKRSVGVQVDPQDTNGVLVPPLDEDGLKDRREQQQGAAAHRSQVGPARKQQIVVQTADVGQSRLCEADCPADGKAGTESVLDGAWDETLQNGSAQSSLAKSKPLIVLLDRLDAISPQKVKFVCPLNLGPEPPPAKPDVSEKPVKAEAQQACISTTGGSAYSLSPSDGSPTPAEVGVWERVHTPKENNDLHMKLKLASPEQQSTRPCRVHLVDMLTVPESERKFQDGDARGQNSKSRNGLHPLKDLRHHQGLHTGHRICCFSPCGNGTWRLKKVVAHTREGYVCSTCHKTFTRRKILRRHQRFHSGEKPYSCPACSKTFALRKSLRRHRRFHTGERPYMCPKCGKSFRLRENLKAHVRFHTGEKPYSCSTCGKMFRIARNLEKHGCHAVLVPSFRTIAGL
ncbi:zinc finger protein 135 [Takifugu flavidus]|uniref:C2H2-type domain-containing protein n=1 Tax=Takifugu flavidus TaxID=433684 RepID=A0A5C6P4A6_9TELE|nr:zinc finger protein 135 [Takifugu flavidus]TWW72957.1 hypothetical protein D4764_15G0003510 [Takifugu flavidus]